MKRKLLLTVSLIFIGSVCFAQTDSSRWAKWSWLVGEWKGEGAGEPGKGSGTFSFKTDLNDKILVRKSHSEYPQTGDRPANVHDDLMIVYPDYLGQPAKAIYFDNEGHTINYTITYEDKAVVLVSDKAPGFPVFRLTYTFIDKNTVNTKFQMSPSGENFRTYIEGKNTRIK